MLREGDTSSEATLLQQMLNYERNRVDSGSSLPVTGVVDSATITAVHAFQRHKWLEVRDRVDDACWNCLRGEERYNVLHDVPYIAQPDELTCWAASLAMIRYPRTGDVSAGSILATTYGHDHPDGPEVEAHLNPIGHIDDSNQQSVAEELRRAFPDLFVSFGDLTRPQLIDRVARSPMLIYTLQGAQNAHAMCIVGLRGNSDSDAVLTLRLYDPWSSTREYWSAGQASGIRSITLQHLRYHYLDPFFVWATRGW
jgi:hypothetical protein